MAIGYNTPGVSVRESISPSTAPLLAGPTLVALVGAAAGEQSATERILLSGLTAVPFAHTGIDTTSVVVKSIITGATLSAGNYVVVETDPDVGTVGEETSTIARRDQPNATGLAAAVGTSTGITGTFEYAVSFTNAGGETGIGPVSNAVTVTDQKINLSNIEVGAAGTTARNIYRRRTSAGTDGKFHLVATINDNAATTLTGENTAILTAEGDQVTTFGTAQPKEALADGGTVLVTYDYTDLQYNQPTILSDLDDIYEKYGQPFASDGSINSKLSLGALFAFINGATELILVAADSDTDAEVSEALVRLDENELTAIVVPLRGTASAAAAASAHATSATANGKYRIAVVGRDGTTTPIAADTLRAAAQAFNSESTVLVSPTSFQTENPITGKPVNLGGEYAAAAVAGMFAAREVEVPLTRKSVAGFTQVNDTRTATELIQDSSAGLLAIQPRGGQLQVRHSVTTAVGNTKTREASVVRAKYAMASRLARALESYIGLVSTPLGATAMITGAVMGVLDSIVLEGSISDYSGVKARVLESDPTVIEVRFSYTPAWPINNITVIFTVNTSTGDFTLT